jgi:5-methyltetrahydrofolate--homocysteine methyltransferase
MHPVEVPVQAALSSVYEGILAGSPDQTMAGVREALRREMPPEHILNDGLIAAMTEVGRRYERDELFVPEMLVSAKAMGAGLALLRPRLVEEGVPTAGKVVLGTVKGDLHDIGKNLVGMMLEGAGYDVIDLGNDVSPQRFVAAVEEHAPLVVGMSALLTTTMQSMQASVEALRDARAPVAAKIIVGGAPVSEAFAVQIGADGYAPDASRAVALVRSLLE